MSRHRNQCSRCRRPCSGRTARDRSTTRKESRWCRTSVRTRSRRRRQRREEEQRTSQLSYGLLSLGNGRPGLQDGLGGDGASPHFFYFSIAPHEQRLRDLEHVVAADDVLVRDRGRHGPEAVLGEVGGHLRHFPLIADEEEGGI